MSNIDKRKVVSSGIYTAQGGGAAAIGTIAAARYAAAFPDVGAAEIAAVAAGAAWLINLAVKMIRDKLHKSSALPVVLVLVVLLVGCGTWKQYDPAVLIDGEPALVSSGRFGGQGHLSITEENGVTNIEVVQFGVSDVLGGTIKGIVGMAAGVFGGNPEPTQINIQVPSMPEVSVSEGDPEG